MRRVKNSIINNGRQYVTSSGTVFYIITDGGQYVTSSGTVFYIITDGRQHMTSSGTVFYIITDGRQHVTSSGTVFYIIIDVRQFVNNSGTVFFICISLYVLSWTNFFLTAFAIKDMIGGKVLHHLVIPVVNHAVDDVRYTLSLSSLMSRLKTYLFHSVYKDLAILR